MIAKQPPHNDGQDDVLAIIVRRLLPSPEAFLILPQRRLPAKQIAEAPRQADRCWCEYRSQIRIERKALLNMRLVSKLLRGEVTRDEVLWFRLCLGLYPKFTARLTGCAAFNDLVTAEAPVLDRSWFVVLQARVGLPLPCMQCGETFTELGNHLDACRHRSAGSGCVFDWDLDDFVTAPHTCCNQTDGCKQGFHDAEDGILSPDWKQRSYDTAHM